MISLRTLFPDKAEVEHPTINNRGKIPETIKNSDSILKKAFQETQPELKEARVALVCR